jgi:protocatechuate 3,4-dioxygenase beta subunit
MMKRFQTSRLVVALCVVCLSGVVDGQAPTPGSVTPRRDTAQRVTTGTARIRGRVLVAPANTPLRRAQMVLVGADNPEFRRIAQTDADGRYEFSELPVGRFSLVASAGGYVALQYGQRRPFESGTPIPLREGETVTSIDFALPRGSVIAGRVTDEFGQPLVQAQLSARRFRYTENGQRTLVLASNPPVVTDDRGEFRLFGLMPGEYIVDAGLRSIASLYGAPPNPNSFLEGFQPTYYPGTPSAAEAQPISLGVGQERNIQLTLTGARLVQVTGVVRDSQDRPIFAQVQMWTRMADLSTPFSVMPGGSTSVTTNADGSFAFQGVLPGEYVLEVRNRVPGALGPQPVPETGFLPLSVRGGDMTDLRIMTSLGSSVSGRVVWEGSSAPAGQAVRVTAQTADSVIPGTIMVGNVDESGNFRVGGLRGPVYLNVPGSANWNWTVKSVTLAGQNITDVPLDLADRPNLEGVQITMTDKLSSVSGHVTDASGKPVPQYVIVVQPADQKEPRVAARFIRTGRPDIDGRFELLNVRPGRYIATAVEALEDGRQFSPEFQKELRRSAREFAVKEGETLTLDLRLTLGL